MPNKKVPNPTQRLAKRPLQQEIDDLRARYNAGDIIGAEKLAKALVRKFPNHPFGWKALAAAARRSGRLLDCLVPMRHAIRLDANNAAARNELGIVLADLGRASEAENSYRDAIRLKPDYADAHNNLGNALRTLGRFDEAETSYREAIRLKPDYALAHSNLGVALNALRRLDEAERAYREAIHLDPNLVLAHNNLGSTLKDLGRLGEAESSYRQAVRLKPDLADLHNNLGNTLSDLGRTREAESSYREAIRLRPDFADAHNNLGNRLKDLGQLHEAESSYREAIRLKPDYALAFSNLGVVLKDLGRSSEAEQSYREAVRLDPDLVLALNNLGAILVDRGSFVESEAHLRRALAVAPRDPDVFGNILFMLNYHPDYSAEQIYADYVAFDQRIGQPSRSFWRAHENAPPSGRRLKIGYVSPDFSRHSTRFFLEPLLARHDRSAFELCAYAELRAEDGWTARYKTYFDRWVPTHGLDDAALADRIRADGIDILVDLAGHTRNTRLSVFARKPAPVSVSWLGYAYTTGLSAIDYFLTDEICAPPGSESLFAETPWRIATPSYVYRPAENMGSVGELPALRRGFVTFGTLTRAARINSHSIKLWSRILHSVPGSRLVIDSFSFVDPLACEDLAARFAPFGIARDRLEIGYHSPPWDVLRNIDIGFDCFPHNSGVTLFECLYMGLPYVTLAGRPSVGRIGSSILHGVGHPEWIAHTPDAYLQIAIDLASDLQKLAAIRSRLRAEMQTRPIMDESGFARRVEDAYRQMFIKWHVRR